MPRLPHRARGHRTLMTVAVVLLTAASGCAVADPAADDATTARAGNAAPGREWHYYAEGQRPDPADPQDAPAQEPQPAPPHELQEQPEPHRVEPLHCVNWLRPDIVGRLDVTPGARTATVTWPNTVNARLKTYRVTTVPQQLPGGDRDPFAVRDVKPVADCSDVSVTIDGLQSGKQYVFWLTAVIDNGTSGIREPLIARSAAVTID